MFVPRQIQKKAKVLARAPPPPPEVPPKKTETRKTDTKLCANDDINPVTARETVMALEMLLSDFSMEHVYGNWLRERMREVEGKDDCGLS